MDNNYRQELRNPTDGQVYVIGSPATAARLRAQGYEIVDHEAPEGPVGETTTAAPVAEQKPPRGAAAKRQQDAPNTGELDAKS